LLIVLTVGLVASAAAAERCSADAACAVPGQVCLRGQCGPESRPLGHKWPLVTSSCAEGCGVDEACRFAGEYGSCSADSDCEGRPCKEGFCREERCVGRLRYSVDPAGSDDFEAADQALSVNAVKDAMRSWKLVPCTIWDAKHDDERVVDSWSATDDGINKYYFDEHNAHGFGGGTLGVTVMNFGNGVTRDADIIFNGYHHTWTTEQGGSGSVDVFSVALHEIGHALGLDHPCEGCSVDAIMSPAWSGHPEIGPRPSDVDGVCDLYPGVRPPVEDATLRLGEPCTADCECSSGMCRYGQCSRRCMIDDPCPKKGGTKCVLARDGQGICGALQAGTDDQEKYPLGALCSRRTADKCVTGVCEQIEVHGVNRFLCTSACSSDAACADDAMCKDGYCVMRTVDLSVCTEGDPDLPESCGCSEGAPSFWFIAVALALLGRRRMRSFG
jgi:uncharacterized protein (TIGR03382 family)